MACEPQELVTAAGCFICKVPNLDTVEIYLLCAVANGGIIPPPPEDVTVIGGEGDGVIIGGEGGGDGIEVEGS